MGFDLYPMDTVAFKSAFTPELISTSTMIFFAARSGARRPAYLHEGSYGAGRSLQPLDPMNKPTLASLAAAACTTWPR